MVRVLAVGTGLWKIYFRGGWYPSTWNELRTCGPVATAPFDHRLMPAHEQGWAILYAALEGLTSVAELFQRTRVTDRRRNLPWLVGFRLAADAALLDVTGTWPTAAGALMAIIRARS